MKTTLKVSELIAKLQQLPQDSDVVIMDADTYWFLNIEVVEVSTKEGVVTISGSYGNEYSAGEI